jgi:hypothetical protein
VIENEDVARLRRIGSTEPARLTEDELVRYHRLLGVYFRFQDNLYLQRQLGTLDRDQYEGYRTVLEGLLSEPGPRQYWQQHSKNYSSLFRAFVAANFEP